MSDFRKERVEKLLQELRYEVSRGLMEKELEEHMGFEFHVPVSRTTGCQAVMCSFRIQPIQYYPPIHQDDYKYGPHLRIIK